MTGKHERTEKKQKNELLSWIKSIAIAVILALILRFGVFEFVVVQGDSMAPGLHTGQIVFVEKVSKLFSQPEYGEIVVVKYSEIDERYYVKRVVGLPGDRLEISDGMLYRNGKRVAEDYLLEPYINQEMQEIVVPEEHIFVMGDNRNYSMDSRSSGVGAIPDRDLIGVGKFVMLPLKEIKSLS